MWDDFRMVFDAFVSCDHVTGYHHQLFKTEATSQTRRFVFYFWVLFLSILSFCLFFSPQYFSVHRMRVKVKRQHRFVLNGDVIG